MTVPGPGWLPGSFRKPAHIAEAIGTEQLPDSLSGGVTAYQLPLGVVFLSMKTRLCANSPYWDFCEPRIEWSPTHMRCLT
jgi:hypothetical protein